MEENYLTKKERIEKRDRISVSYPGRDRIKTPELDKKGLIKLLHQLLKEKRMKGHNLTDLTEKERLVIEKQEGIVVVNSGRDRILTLEKYEGKLRKMKYQKLGQNIVIKSPQYIK